MYILFIKNKMYKLKNRNYLNYSPKLKYFLYNFSNFPLFFRQWPMKIFFSVYKNVHNLQIRQNFDLQKL